MNSAKERFLRRISQLSEAQAELEAYFEAEARLTPAELKAREDRWAEANARELIREEPWLGRNSTMSEIAHITVSGDLEGDFVVTEELAGGKFLIQREASWKAMLEEADERDTTEAEIAAIEREHGPFLPPDGEG